MQAEYDYRWSSEHWCDIPLDECGVKFRLIYRGPLKPQGSADPRHKQQIRRQFELQLSVLWNSVPFLHQIADTRIRVPKADGGYEDISRIEKIARAHSKGGFRFVPLVTKEFGLACSLKVLMLRREEPGEKLGGDLDNRFKVLIDALKIPEGSELVTHNPEEDPDPFFCLLEDDERLTDFQVKSDRLLIPDNYPMNPKVFLDSARTLYGRLQSGEVIPTGAAWDRELSLEMDRSCEHYKVEREVWGFIEVTLLCADPSADDFHSDFLY